MDLKRKNEDKIDAKTCHKVTKQNRTHPNIFLGIRLFNPETRDSINMIQKSIIENEPKLCSTLVKLTSLHLTIKTFRIEIEDIDRIKQCMSECNEMLNQSYESISLDISGLQTFNGNVLFAKIASNSELEKLTNLSEKMDVIFSDSGFNCSDKRPFNPHITIMKISKAYRLKNEMKKVCQEMCEKYGDHHFGKELVKGFQLCWMSKDREMDPDGYYSVIDEFPLFKKI